MRFYNCFIVCVLALFTGSACKFNPNVQGRGSSGLQGIWEESPLEYRDSLLQYTSHRFKFTCDSFYVTLSTRSKVNYYGDNCFNKGKWEEYAKGTYAVSHDTLYINGTFTRANFKQKLSGCYRIGQYLPVFIIKNISSQKIELFNPDQNIPVTLKLKEKLTCNPQPL